MHVYWPGIYVEAHLISNDFNLERDRPQLFSATNYTTMLSTSIERISSLMDFRASRGKLLSGNAVMLESDQKFRLLTRKYRFRPLTCAEHPNRPTQCTCIIALIYLSTQFHPLTHTRQGLNRKGAVPTQSPSLIEQQRMTQDFIA